ncbi:DNA replication/repair protein RecF [Gaopeijia maritima]|uniref:DNA replication/repair protein RecF n=1 Tax=Gaopeijia maritima TaxID=3119007 RepID=UPI00324D8F02
MRLTHLSIRRFRNLESQELDLPPEGVALVGENAQGKSNFLEAIYYLETFRSFRGARDDQLIAFGEEVFRVAGRLTSPDASEPAVEVAAAFQRKGRKKKVTVDGAEPERLSDGLGRLAAVIFSPSDVAIVNEGPSERRRFLDIVLSLNVPGYLRSLQTYRQALQQRNAALKDGRSSAVVSVWDEPLVRSGAEVTAERARWIESVSEEFTGYYTEVSGGQSAVPTYKPSVDTDRPTDAGAAADAYRDGLAAVADRERRMGTTVVGPHRDEVTFAIEGDRDLDVRDYGSGGQRRTAALALRLVEASTIRAARGQEPIVLMDDVFAELDEGRSERILQLIEREETGQVILTVPKESDVKVRRDALPRWGIRDGKILT